MNQVEYAIAAINAEELMRRRMVRGKDLNDWLGPLQEMIDAGQDAEALELLEEIMSCCETLEQFDPREPQPFWYEKACGLLRRSRRYEEEARTLTRWLSRWPAERPRGDLAQERIEARREYARELKDR